MIQDGQFGYEPNLPESIRQIYAELCQDVRALRSKWNFYLGLFRPEENADLLSELASASFLMIEESLRADLTLTIGRLNDPSQSLGHKNLSFQALVDQLEKPGKAGELLDDFQAACAPVETFRNKRVAHNDQDTKLGAHASRLFEVGQREIDRIVQLAEQILNAVLQRYVNSELRFETIWPGGADDLIFWLKAGREAESEKKAKKLDAYLGKQ